MKLQKDYIGRNVTIKLQGENGTIGLSTTIRSNFRYGNGKYLLLRCNASELITDINHIKKLTHNGLDSLICRSIEIEGIKFKATGFNYFQYTDILDPEKHLYVDPNIMLPSIDIVVSVLKDNTFKYITMYSDKISYYGNFNILTNL